MTTRLVRNRVVNWDINEVEEPVPKPVLPVPSVATQVKRKRGLRKAPSKDPFIITGDQKREILQTMMAYRQPLEPLSTQPNFKVFPRTGAYYKGA